MKRLKYANYRPTGVDWLGGIPDHWNLMRLKMVATVIDRKTMVDAEPATPYIGMTNVESWTGRLSSVDDTLPRGIANTFKADHTLFGKLRPYLAKAWNPTFDGLCSTEFLVLKSTEIDRKLLLFILLSDGFIGLVNSSAYGSKMPRANWHFVGSCKLPLPPSNEQESVVRFLDKESTRIDTLLVKMQLLIERAKEKHIALISRTVTRGLPPTVASRVGLDPHPRLKPSGIRWIGNVPEHWNVNRLGNIGTLSKGGGGNKGDEVASGVPCIRYGDLYTTHRDFILKSRSCVSGSVVSEYTPIRFGDVLFAASGETLDEIGKSSVNLMSRDACCGGDIILFRAEHKVDARYMGYAMNCSPVAAQKAMMGRGITIMHIYRDQLKNLTLALPPLHEQILIAEFLDQETSRIDAMISKLTTAVERLQEYRSALVTAAVTGAIDVHCGIPRGVDDGVDILW